MLARPIDGGIELAVRVSAGASRTRIVGTYGERLKLQVAAAPERGKANGMVCELIAQSLRVPTSAVRIVKGHAAPDKIVQVRGVGLDALDRIEWAVQ